MSEALLLCSGGLDSTTLAYWLRDRGIALRPVFFDYGQHCVEKEWATVNEVLPQGVMPIVRIDISGIFHGSPSRLISEPDLWAERVNAEEMYIPYRTMLFFSAAAAYAQTHGLTIVYSGFINSNHAKEIDCSSEFLNNIGRLASNVGPVHFEIPFRDVSKKEVAEMALRLKVPIGKTFSCQIYSDVPCGACPNCVDRLAGLRDAGLIQ